ncbi:MAG: hypothetical protein ACKOXM_02190 [Agromyces sp.]
MSAQFAVTPERRAQSMPARLLRALPRAKSRSTLPTIATSAVDVVVLAQLLIGVALANGAYQMEALESSKAQELRNLTAVSEDLARVQSPQYIASNASAIGMISNSNAVYLRLSDGAILGVPMPARGQTLAGANVPNSLLAGVPLVTQLNTAGSSPTATADAASGTSATPGSTTDQTATTSVPLPGAIPAVHTR